MRHWALIALLLVAVVVGFACAPGGPSSFSSGARVVEVIDGDTLEVAVGGRTERVRLFGVDTPESTTLRNGRVECGGSKATALARQLAGGRTVRLRTDARGDAEDRFGRLLRYVELPGGDDLGEALVGAGWAAPFRFRGRDFDRASAYDAAARRARSGGRGVHRSCGGDFHRPR